MLCGANSYEQKYYFNQDFSGLPEQIRQELQIMCVLFTEDVGGILMLEFLEDGTLRQKTDRSKGLTQRQPAYHNGLAGVWFQNATGGGKSLKQNSSISSMPRYASDSVSLATL